MENFLIQKDKQDELDKLVFIQVFGLMTHVPDPSPD